MSRQASGSYARWGISFLAIFIIAMVTIATLLLNNIEHHTRTHMLDKIASVLKVAQGGLFFWYNEHMVAISEWSLSEPMIDFAKTQLAIPRNKNSLLDNHSRERLLELFEDEMSGESDFIIYIVSPDYINIASTHGSIVGNKNVVAIEYHEQLEKVFDGIVRFIPPIRSDVPLPGPDGIMVTGIPSMFIAAPIIDYDGKIIAALVMRLDADREFNIVSQVGQFGDTGEIYLFDGKGRIVSESRFYDQLVELGLVAKNSRSVFSLEARDPGGDMTKGYIPAIPRKEQPLTRMAREAIIGTSGRSTDGYRDYRGVRVLGTWLWDRDFDMGFAAEIDENEALEPYFEMQIMVYGGIALTAILALFLSFLQMRIMRRGDAALRKSEQRYAATTAASRIYVWDWDIATDGLYVDPFLRSLLGYKDQEGPEYMGDWSRQVHTGYREKSEADLDRSPQRRDRRL